MGQAGLRAFQNRAKNGSTGSQGVAWGVLEADHESMNTTLTKRREILVKDGDVCWWCNGKGWYCYGSRPNDHFLCHFCNPAHPWHESQPVPPRDANIGRTWAYRPSGRLDQWNMWLARHDLLPKGCLAPVLGRMLK